MRHKCIRVFLLTFKHCCQPVVLFDFLRCFVVVEGLIKLHKLVVLCRIERGVGNKIVISRATTSMQQHVFWECLNIIQICFRAF